ncbi:MAG: DUF4190 domain-containing protein [Phycisphaerae bacterium]|nr:DUF4190 domain-containing protein [Phycisphaerae bacterium]
MNEFNLPVEESFEPPVPSGSLERSKLAIWSLTCSLIFCCPIVTIFGPILGAIALIKMKSNPRSGKGMAISGIIIGVITTVLSVGALLFAFTAVKKVMNQVTESASEVITASYAKEYDKARESFAAQTNDVTNEDLQSFANELQSRYGAFDSITFNWLAEEQQLEPKDQFAPMPVILIFETESVHATIMFEVVPGGDFAVSKFCCIQIEDAVHGNVIFPLDSPCAQ